MALRWVVPVLDAAIPLDTIRLAIAVEVTGAAETSIPVSSSGAGQSATVAIRSDAGLAIGSLSFTTLDAGQLFLTAGWSGGPLATTTVNVLPVRAVEMVGANPPSHGVNTADFEPNDPAGNAWRRDDVVPLRVWPGAQLIARHVQPDASAALIDAGEACDGGCSALRLQDVEFNAFRGDVELQVVSDAGWEARGDRLKVTRWRWRRVVSGVPNPIKVQTPVLTHCSFFPSAVCIVVGTEDSRSTGRLAVLSEEGTPMTNFWLPQTWTFAVTAPIDGCHQVVAGFDGDAGFLWSGQSRLFGGDSVGERYVLLGGTDVTSVAVTDQAGVVGVPDTSDVFTETRPPLRSGRCRFDAGTPQSLGTARFNAAITSSSGELCIAPEFLPFDAGTTLLASDLVFPLAIAGGPNPHAVTTDGRFVRLTPRSTVFDAGVVDTLVQAGGDWYFFTSEPALVSLIAPTLPGGVWSTRVSAVPWRVLSPPIFRAQRRSVSNRLEGMLYAVGTNQRLMALSTDTLSESWGWSPDGGLELAAPMGFAPSETLNGSVLLPTRDSVISLVADGVLLRSSWSGWTQAGGDPWNCGSEGPLLGFR
ncbi:MAG: hypothetical protein GQE15_09265 [Archangiaceae bacterium]|nr:hypothetical protein [Archangiaceae bacterium]